MFLNERFNLLLIPQNSMYNDDVLNSNHTTRV